MKSEKMRTVIGISIAFFGIIVAGACKKSSTDNRYTPDCSSAHKYASEVAPLISAYCSQNSGCHASGSSNGVGALTNYTQVFNARSSIRESVVTGKMPQDNTLTNAQKDIIICWIDSGAPNN